MRITKKESLQVVLLLVFISFISYVFDNVAFGILFSLMLLTHEYGHVWAGKKCGIPSKGMYFIPFFGAVAIGGRDFKSAKEEVFTAAMGPIWGLAAILMAYAAYLITKEVVFLSAAIFMTVVNLINLMPVNPMDGGRIVKSIAYSVSPRFSFHIVLIGLSICAVLSILMKWPIFMLVGILGIFDYKQIEKKEFEIMPKKECLATFLLYILIILIHFKLISFFNFLDPNAEKMFLK